MFAFFQSRHVKQGRAFVKDAKKLLAYKRDLVPAETIAEVEGEIAGLEEAVRGRDKKKIEERAHRLDHSCGKLTRPVADSGWRENCEVFLVAIVIALGVRTYFLQPFTIPTGSMQPTLNGIRGYRSEAAPPNIAVQFWETLWAGRTYVDKVAKSDETIVEVSEVKSLLPFIEKTPFLGNVGFFSRTRIRTDRNSYIIKENPAPVMRDFLTAHAVGRGFKKGEPIVRGYFEAGDHVFVDKMTYHFRPPKRGEVFVFNTQNIATGDNVRMQMRGPSQYYIKRLAGLPGDMLRIEPPELLINGKRASEPGFQRVMALEGGYRGYSNQSEQELGSGVIRFRMKLLGAPEEVFHVPVRNYFALGDNSFHSSDSRDWGSVPEQNLMGRGVFVYWPFRQHFGVIR